MKQKPLDLGEKHKATEQPLEVKDLGEFFAEMTDHTHSMLMAEGLSSKRSIDITIKLITRLSATFAGESFYVTKKPGVYARWMQIYMDLQYMHSADVDKKYTLSQGYSLKVKRKILERRLERSQLRFAFMDDPVTLQLKNEIKAIDKALSKAPDGHIAADIDDGEVIVEFEKA